MDDALPIVGIIFGLLVGIAIAMWAANIAEGKGYNGALAGILAFLFGWVVLLVYYLLPDNSGAGSGTTRSAPRNVSGTEARRQQMGEAPPGTCRVCGYENAPRDSRCYQCGNMMAQY